MKFRPAMALLVSVLAFSPTMAGGEQPVLRLTTFLDRLMTVDHLPAKVAGHTKMASTWSRKDDNRDGDDFKRIEGDRNILLDLDGPGCVHRIFTGMLGKNVAGTRIRILLDNQSTAVFDMPVDEFFDDRNGPFPYPLVFHKTYPGTLFPIPFAKHCRIELFSPDQKKNWGNYWQVTYTQYPKDTPVETLRWPLSGAEKKTVDQACRTWLRAQSSPPEAPRQWTSQKQITLKPGEAESIVLSGGGVIRQLRLHASPSTPEVLSNVKMQLAWDGRETPAVDMPIGYFFGNVQTGQRDHYYSLLLGVDKDYVYCRFPMPFERGASLRLENGSDKEVTLQVYLDVEPLDSLSAGVGRFHARLRETEIQEHCANKAELPRCGALDTPVHEILDLEHTRGKYVGLFLHVDWPESRWWGEGDMLIWADEDGWPPAYHGTGTEEYFNSGWGLFDQKAVSGCIREPKMHPGHVGVYTFHLNDAFSFEDRLRIAVEIWPAGRLDQMPHSFWRSTAYWYEFSP